MALLTPMSSSVHESERAFDGAEGLRLRGAEVARQHVPVICVHDEWPRAEHDSRGEATERSGLRGVRVDDVLDGSAASRGPAVEGTRVVDRSKLRPQPVDVTHLGAVMLRKVLE